MSDHADDILIEDPVFISKKEYDDLMADTDKHTITLSVGELVDLVDKERNEAIEEAKKEIEKRVREEYAASPVYRGLLGLLSRIVGLAPDSTGKPSGSWTLYLLSHIPALVFVVSLSVSLIFSKNIKAYAGIPVTPILLPMILAWIAWIAHHDKLTNAVIRIGTAIAQAVISIKSTGISGAIGGLATSLLPTNTVVQNPGVEKLEERDLLLKAGQRFELKKKAPDAAPKTDPNTLPAPPTTY